MNRKFHNIVVENTINQKTAELIGTFTLTTDLKWIFMELMDDGNGNKICCAPENPIEIKQVGIKKL